jgi:hypothetical protein
MLSAWPSLRVRAARFGRGGRPDLTAEIQLEARRRRRQSAPSDPHRQPSSRPSWPRRPFEFLPPPPGRPPRAAPTGSRVFCCFNPDEETNSSRNGTTTATTQARHTLTPPIGRSLARGFAVRLATNSSLMIRLRPAAGRPTTRQSNKLSASK